MAMPRCQQLKASGSPLWLAPDLARCAQWFCLGVFRLRLASAGRPGGFGLGVERRCKVRWAAVLIAERVVCSWLRIAVGLKPREYWPQENWRSRPESNWGRRICNPLPNHLATGP